MDNFSKPNVNIYIDSFDNICVPKDFTSNLIDTERLKTIQNRSQKTRYLKSRFFLSQKLNFYKNQKLYFNISHTKNFLAVAISDVKVGIDIEEKKRSLPNFKKISKKMFHREEKKQVTDPLSFLEIWTLKEATVKAFNRGLPLFPTFHIESPTKNFHFLQETVSFHSFQNAHLVGALSVRSCGFNFSLH